MFLLTGIAWQVISNYRSLPSGGTRGGRTSCWGIVFLAGAIWAFVLTFGGFWASQQMVSARAALLISWVGLLAPFRAITEMVAQAPRHQRGVNREDGKDTGYG